MTWILAFGSGFLLQISAETHSSSEMVLIPKGLYRPLFSEPQRIKNPRTQKVEQKLVRGRARVVKSFYLDRYPVTREKFQKFVLADVTWKRSRVKRLFADQTYLKDWANDSEPGTQQNPESPVRYVSWFSARAYCESRGKRLPTLSEWELAGSAYKNFNQFKKKILEWYGEPMQEKVPQVGSTFANLYGVYDLHGLLWEWVEDFNSNLVTGESRGDSTLERDAFCGSGALGAADFEDYAAFMRFGFRSSLRGSFTLANLGFRCVKDVSP